jgi:hypothetical protein
MLGVFDVKLSTEFAGGGLHPLVDIFPTGRAEATVHGFVRPAVRTEITFGIDGRTGFEHEDLHAPFSEFFRGHSACGP